MGYRDLPSPRFRGRFSGCVSGVVAESEPPRDRKPPRDSRAVAGHHIDSESCLELAHRAFANLAWSPDGNAIASASLDGTSAIWEVSGSGHKVRHGHEGPIRAVAWSRTGEAVATAGDDRIIVVWDRASGESTQLLGHAEAISDVLWSPDDRLLASASEDRTIRIWTKVGRDPPHT